LPSRIAFCITTLEPGGAERQLVELATRLPRDRFEPAVVVLAARPRPPRDTLVHTLDRNSIPLVFLGGRHVWQTLGVYRRLGSWLENWRPALLQCFLAHANILGAYAGRRLGIPIVTGIRVAEQRLNGHCWLQRRTDAFVQKHVCVSASVADFAERVMRLAPDKLIVIPNGVDTERFRNVEPIPPTELGISPGRRLILFVGRLEADKRPNWLIDRMPAIAARLPNHDLVIAGRGPLEHQLGRQAERLGVAGRVHLMGWRPDVPRLLAAADLLVLTSSSEGMPNVVLEAMAAARPVIATQVHGVAELLGDGAAAQVVPSHDTEAFVDAVVRVADDRGLATSLGHDNRDRAETRFSLGATADRYASLYDSLLRVPRSKKSVFDR